jgi:hypothetical protein
VSPLAHRTPDGDLVLSGLSPWLVAAIFELPGILAAEPSDEVRKRLYPSPSEDNEAMDEEWARLVHPELFALLASAREIVERDIGNLSLTVPADHVQAWISALNAARLTLAETHGVEEDDLEGRADTEGWSEEKEGAVVRLEMLGWFQEMLIRAVAPPPPGAEDEEPTLDA